VNLKSNNGLLEHISYIHNLQNVVSHLFHGGFAHSHVQELLNFTSFWTEDTKSNNNKAQLLQHIPKITVAVFDHI